jgi:hypothetical protein
MVLLLVIDRSFGNARMFTLGWLLGLAAVGAPVLAIASTWELIADNGETAMAGLIQLGIGLFLLGLAVIYYRKWPKQRAARVLPDWAVALPRTTRISAALLAMRLAATTPKNFFLTAGTAVAIAQFGYGDGWREWAVLGLFIVLSSLGLFAIIALSVHGNRTVRRAIIRLKNELIPHGDAVLAAVFLTFGTWRSIEGLVGFVTRI